MRNIDTKFYLFGSFARSLDHYHVNNNIIHVIGSIFYTNEDYSFKLLNIPNNKNVYIIRIVTNNNVDFNVKYHKEHLVEFKINYNNFFILYKNKSIENKNF